MPAAAGESPEQGGGFWIDAGKYKKQLIIVSDDLEWREILSSLR